MAMATREFNALNAQLKTELPRFLQLMLESLRLCIQRFLELRLSLLFSEHIALFLICVHFIIRFQVSVQYTYEYIYSVADRAVLAMTRELYGYPLFLATRHSIAGQFPSPHLRELEAEAHNVAEVERWTRARHTALFERLDRTLACLHPLQQVGSEPPRLSLSDASNGSSSAITGLLGVGRRISSISVSDGSSQGNPSSPLPRPSSNVRIYFIFSPNAFSLTITVSI